MPEVIVYAVAGRSLDQKRGLVKAITEAVQGNRVKKCVTRA